MERIIAVLRLLRGQHRPCDRAVKVDCKSISPLWRVGSSTFFDRFLSHPSISPFPRKSMRGMMLTYDRAAAERIAMRDAMVAVRNACTYFYQASLPGSLVHTHCPIVHRIARHVISRRTTGISSDEIRVPCGMDSKCLEERNEYGFPFSFFYHATP